MSELPSRIICLTEETTEILYSLGEQDRIVGISGFTVRPRIARKQKPKVSAFTSARIPRILELKPDLVLGFSDMQADIAAELVRAGVAVHVFNQRSVAEIFNSIRLLGAMVGATQRTAALIQQLEHGISHIRAAGDALPRRPRVYFEEWDDPLISGIRWVSELIAIAGGEDCFETLSRSHAASGRIIADSSVVVGAAPDIIIGSWCGKKFRPEKVCARAGWSDIPAVRNAEVHEIKSAEILQPGPAALTDGLASLHGIIKACALR